MPEIEELFRMLEGHGFVCCLVGVSALVFYGAERLQHEWEVCVPTEKVNDVVDLLTSEEFASLYIPAARQPDPQPASLTHTYHRFQIDGTDFQFALIPSYHAHIPCTATTIRRSIDGLPYPKLCVFIQSCLDTNDAVALCDVIDGTNVSEEWGVENLSLDGTNDLEWAGIMNEQLLIPSVERGGEVLWALCFPTRSISRRDTWEWRVRAKIARLGWTRPEELFDTRFTMKGSRDPWLVPSSAIVFDCKTKVSSSSLPLPPPVPTPFPLCPPSPAPKD